MKYIKLLVCLTVVSAVMACSDNENKLAQVREILSDAELALNSGKYDNAIELCNSLLNSEDTTVMTWRDYTRAASIYAIAYDHNAADEEAVASAGLCLDRARATHPDSVDMYIISHGPEYIGALNTIVQTLDGMTGDRSTYGDHEEDAFVDSLVNAEMHEHIHPDSLNR